MTTLLVVSGIVAFGFIGGVIGRKLFGENCNKIIDYNSDEETIFNFRCTEVHVTDSNDLNEQLLSQDRDDFNNKTPEHTPNFNSKLNCKKNIQTNNYNIMDSNNRFKNDIQ